MRAHLLDVPWNIGPEGPRAVNTGHGQLRRWSVIGADRL